MPLARASRLPVTNEDSKLAVIHLNVFLFKKVNTAHVCVEGMFVRVARGDKL